MAEEKKNIHDKKPKKLSEVEELRIRLKDAEDLAKRMKADYENLSKQVEKDKANYCESVYSIIMTNLLPVLDSFEMALKGDLDKKGLVMVYNQLLDILKKEGLSEIDALWQKFDPYLHEIVLQGESDKEEGTIIEELQKGYKFRQRVIRHSKVKVAKPRGDQPGSSGNDDDGHDKEDGQPEKEDKQTEKKDGNQEDNSS